MALLGWSGAAWHLGPRDEWLGWSEEQRRRRLHFLAQNSRFVILADRTRRERRGLVTRAIEPGQLGLVGAARTPSWKWNI